MSKKELPPSKKAQNMANKGSSSEILANERHKKNISYRPLRKLGGGDPRPPARNQNRYFFLKKRKRFRIFWNGKICKNILWQTFFPIFKKNIEIFLSIFPLELTFFSFIKTYVLDHSASFQCILKNCKKHLSAKKTFCLREGGGVGSERFGLVCNLSFFYAFPNESAE